MQNSKDVTRLLQDHKNGHQDALELLFPKVYEELKAIAMRHMVKERADITLQPTELVHEAYFKLVEVDDIESRRHFFALAATIMRHFLINHAKRKGAVRHGGAYRFISTEGIQKESDGNLDVLELHTALLRLEEVNPKAGKLIELHYFGGFNLKEIGSFFKQSKPTVIKELNIAKRFLYKYLKKPETA